MITIARTDYRSDGIFSDLSFDGEGRFCVTLEHAYDDGRGGYQPKVQPGVYTCVRGTHSLHNGVPFETFEVLGVTGHSGILFHAGNYNRDSEGCILVGHTIATDPNTGAEMVTGSKAQFAEFMARLDGVDTFSLEVI